MDTRSGDIMPFQKFRERYKDDWKTHEPFIQPIDISNLSEKTRIMLEKNGIAKISKNTKCPCGSGRKFKRCCMTLK
jgi:uncharacterized protein YecA (UPF0149 family)